MKKLLKPFMIIAVFVVFAYLLHSLMVYEPFDSWMTSKIIENKEENNIIINNREKGAYGLGEAQLPCIYAKEEHLYMVVGDVTADITPEDINMTYYSRITDFNEMISQKENYLLSEDGKFILYRLIFKGNPYLYLFDIENQCNTFISDRVESFDIMTNEFGRISVIYATGYDNSNKLFDFSYVAGQESNTKCILIADDIENAGVFEKYGSVVYLDKSGNVYKYDSLAGKSTKICSKVDEVYYPGENTYNYTEYYDSFAVCARIQDKDYVLNENEKIEIKDGYYSLIPKYIFTDDNGNIYYYSNSNKKLVAKTEKEEKIIFDEIGDIFHVFGHFQYDSSLAGYFVVATEESLYLLQDDGKKYEELMELPDDYCGFSNMLENHMDVYMVSQDTFLVNSLCSGSLVLNNKNSESWISSIESYNYGLTALRRTEDGFVATELDVPSSRSMSKPVYESANNKQELIYVSYFDDMTVKSASLINDKGQVVIKDILGTSDLAKEQAKIDVLPCENSTYFLYQSEAGGLSFYRFDAKELCLYHVEDENGIFTENYDEFNGVVSFGKLVIF